LVFGRQFPEDQVGEREKAIKKNEAVKKHSRTARAARLRARHSTVRQSRAGALEKINKQVMTIVLFVPF
jgi:hypothetical protein